MVRTAKFSQRPKTAQVACPNFPDHGITIKRWLRGAYARVTAGGAGAQIADVFEVDCPTCGKYERHEECRRS